MPLVAIIGTYLTGSSITIGKEIGIGVILGAPFLLGTLAFFVTGIAVLVYSKTGRRTKEMPVNTTIMFRDLHYFAGAYFIAVMSSFIPFPAIKPLIAVLMIIIYMTYAFRTIKSSCNGPECEVEELEILYLKKFIEVPGFLHFPAIILQILVSLAGIVFLAHLFVGQLKFFSELFKINPLVISLLIAPIATELPEKFNSVIWIRSKKDTLALGNITGAMVFQSCILTAIGLALTPWILNTDALLSVVIVYFSVAIVYFNIYRNKGILKPSALLSGGFFYLLFLGYIFLKYISLFGIKF